MGWISTPHKETALAKSPSSSENIHFVVGLDGAVIVSIQRHCSVYHYQDFNQATDSSLQFSIVTSMHHWLRWSSDPGGDLALGST